MYKPEVGEECEFLTDVSWGTVKFIGMDGDRFVFKPSGEKYYSVGPDDKFEFRPLKSKRDEEIESMTNGVSAPTSNITQMVCEQLYDAGYRKQMPYSQFVSIIQVWLNDMYSMTDNASLLCAQQLSEKLKRTPEQ